MPLPKLERTSAEELIKPFNATNKVIVLGIRGYFKKTMGPTENNDRNIYDDALFIITPELFTAYNGNTDPSRYRPGIAVLKPGMYFYKKGLHSLSSPHPYLALRQDSNVTVIRDGGKEQTDSPQNRFFIDIHRGGYTTTSSLGCQTIHPDQWEGFRDTIFKAMDVYKEPRIPYILIEQ